MIMKTHLKKTQVVAIIAIVAVGLLLAVFILFSGKAKPTGEEHAHEKEVAHETSHAHAAPKTGEQKIDEHADHQGEHKADEHADREGEYKEGGHAEQQAGHQDDHQQKIALTDAQIKAAGVTLQSAGSARIKTSFILPGEIQFNEDRTAHVVPRLSGVVLSVPAELGQQVKKGQVLAVIASTDLSEKRSELFSAQKRMALARLTFDREKKLWEEKISAEQDYLQAQQTLRETEISVQNASQKLAALGTDSGKPGALNQYQIRAPFDGLIVAKHLTLGEVVKEDANIFTVSDLSSVWAEIAISAKDLNAVRVGEKVTVRTAAFESTASGKIAYVGSLLGEQTRTATARVTLENPQGSWRPGLFVNVEIVASEMQVPIAVAADAVQSLDGKSTVFVKTKDGFVAHEVTTGRSDAQVIEIVKGLKAGDEYAAVGSFIVKSELGKASAEHSH